MKSKNKNIKTSCDLCANYAYDEYYDSYDCQIYMDEDEMSRFMSGYSDRCPYFQFDNEYKIVNKQI